MKKISLFILTLVFSLLSVAQDVRTMDTKIADLLARMPVYNQKELKQQMDQMTLLGESGWKRICGQLVPPGSGDDTRVRFLVESYSRFLSAENESPELKAWEKHCITMVKSAENADIKRFLMHQLELVGGEKASEFALKLIDDKEIGDAAVAIVAATHIEDHEAKLAATLKNTNLITAAPVLNILANWKYSGADTDYISWYGSFDKEIKRAALNAMAASAAPGVYKTLRKAAQTSGYSWEPTSATALYLEYASNIADKGNHKLMEKICKEVIKKTDNSSGNQYKAFALTTLVKFKGADMLDPLIDLFSEPDIMIRQHALGLASGIKGDLVTLRLIAALGSVDKEYTPDLVLMLGQRCDKTGISLIC